MRAMICHVRLAVVPIMLLTIVTTLWAEGTTGHLRWRLEPGKRVIYRVQGEGKTLVGTAGKGSIEVRTSWDVWYEYTGTARDDSGSSTIQIKAAKGTGTAFGIQQTIQAQPGEFITVKLDQQGKLVQVVGLLEYMTKSYIPPPFEFLPLHCFLLFPLGLPDENISEGQSWSGETAVEFAGLGKFKIKSTSTLKAVKNVNGDKCAEIHTRVTFPGAQITLRASQAKGQLTSAEATGQDTIEVTGLISVEDDCLIRAELSFKGDLTLQQPGKSWATKRSGKATAQLQRQSSESGIAGSDR